MKVCPIPQERWDDPAHGIIRQDGALKLIDALGYYVICCGQRYEECDDWQSAVDRYVFLSADDNAQSQAPEEALLPCGCPAVSPAYPRDYPLGHPHWECLHREDEERLAHEARLAGRSYEAWQASDDGDLPEGE